MERLYFTFGSDPAYPYGRNDYVVAIGTDRHDCISAFREKHPNRPGSQSYNAAMSYTADEWPEISEKYYKDRTAVDTIVSCNAYGCRPDGYDPLWIFIPATGHLMCLQEGSGDNLSDEDRENGLNDYLYYEIFSMEDGSVTNNDGGELMLAHLVREDYRCLADAIPDILDCAYDNPFLDVRILKSETKVTHKAPI